MSSIRLMIACCVAALSVQSASAAFLTSTYGGAPIPIPDNTPAGLNLDILIPDGILMNQFQSVDILMSTGTPNTATGAHSWVGDLILTLTHVESGLSIDLMRRPGSSTPTGFGDSSNFSGTYSFSSLAAAPRIIDNAALVADGVAVANGTYNPTTNSFNGVGGPTFTGETTTDLNAIFDAMGVMAGTWRLNISDNAGGDIGQINSWAFTADVSGTPAPAAVWMGLAGFGVLGMIRRRNRR